VQRERKIKRRIVILKCIPVKNIFEKMHQETFGKRCRYTLFLANILLLIQREEQLW